MRRCGRHPNVVALLDVLWIAPDSQQTHGEAALVMEVAAGGGLFERLVEEGAYSEEYAAKILRQIAVALYHLHSRGILHRDIKPENVVFGEADSGSTLIKLIDFGTADTWTAQQGLTGLVGTPQYLAPEVVLGWYGTAGLEATLEPYSLACDLWSCGILPSNHLMGTGLPSRNISQGC